MKNKSMEYRNILKKRFDIENIDYHHPRIDESGYGVIRPIKNK
jgi:hypothetical protein